MENKTTKAILVVSFGTSVNATRELTIDAIEKRIAEEFPTYRVYRAWTSKMIIKKLLKRDNTKINTVTEAFAEMAADGITDVIVQPTHVINGIENDLMKEETLAFQDSFHSIAFGTPLLTSQEDNTKVIKAVQEEFSDLREHDALVLMGHGTTHYANSVYTALDDQFKDHGCHNIFLGTVEANPSMEALIHMVTAFSPDKVILAPFMIVAGDHARNDMAGEDPDSWMCQFQRAGFPVETVLKGLGQYAGIQRLFLEHVRKAEKEL